MSNIRNITRDVNGKLVSWMQDQRYFEVLRNAFDKPASVHIRGGQRWSGLVNFKYDVSGVLTEIGTSGFESPLLHELYVEAGSTIGVLGNGTLSSGDGGMLALTELVSPVTLTASGQVRSGVSEYCGFHLRAIVGTPQTVTVYDALSATGTPIHTVAVTALGYYPWSGNKVRPCSLGVYAAITGGTSRSIDFL